MREQEYRDYSTDTRRSYQLIQNWIENSKTYSSLGSRLKMCLYTGRFQCSGTLILSAVLLFFADRCREAICNLQEWTPWGATAQPVSGHCASESRRRVYTKTWREILEPSGCHNVRTTCPDDVENFREKSTQFAGYFSLLSLWPFTPKSDQFQISPVVSPEIQHHSVYITWLFIAQSG